MLYEVITDATVADIDINDTIREIVGLTAQMARYNNVTISTQLDPDLPFIRFSPSELQQVILNLTNNAIDAMGKDGGTVEIVTGINTQDDNMIEIKVDDNGPGRITSYNVCYTKLLRGQPDQEAGALSHLAFNFNGAAHFLNNAVTDGKA